MKQEVKLSLLRIYISHGVPEGLESLRNLENHLLAMLRAEVCETNGGTLFIRKKCFWA